jgi:hypothetical protein
MANLVEAALDTLDGERGRAMGKLETAADAFAGLGIRGYEHATRVRLGRLQGNAAGAQAADAAEAHLRTQGVRDVPRFFDMLAPGFPE